MPPTVVDVAPPSITAAAEEIKYERKYADLKRKVREMEEENNQLLAKLAKVKKNIDRLKVEKRFLLETLEQTYESKKKQLDTFEKKNPPNLPLAFTLATPTLSSYPPQSLTPPSQLAPLKSSPATSASKGPALTKTKSRFAKRDPAAPKRPPNAFLYFCNIRRQELKSERPDIPTNEISKLLGIEWKELSKEKKKIYYDMYDRDKARYDVEMQTYESSQSQLQSQLKLESTSQSPLPASSSSNCIPFKLSSPHLLFPSSTLSPSPLSESLQQNENLNSKGNANVTEDEADEYDIDDISTADTQPLEQGYPPHQSSLLSLGSQNSNQNYDTLSSSHNPAISLVYSTSIDNSNGSSMPILERPGNRNGGENAGDTEEEEDNDNIENDGVNEVMSDVRH